MDTGMAERLREVRTEAGLTQAQFGERLSVSQDTVSLWEKGRSVPTTETLAMICRNFNISADYLLGLKDY